MAGDKSEPRWIPSTEAEKNAVIGQLDRLLMDPIFAKSQRYPSFLRFVVSRALEGESDSLKERILGIEVFGRNADYDTAEDPIVRVTATNIRKRITEYYSHPDHQSELKLSFQTGSYVPVFEQPKLDPVAETADTEGLPGILLVAGTPNTADVSDIKGISFLRSNIWRWAFVFGIVICAVTAIAEGIAWNHARHNAFSNFWKPAMASRQPFLICIADEPRGTVALIDASNPVLPDIAENAHSIIDVDNVAPVTDIGNMLSVQGQASNIQGQRRTTLSDLSAGSDILVGAFNNIWTLRLTKNLRFHFANDPTHSSMWIEDRKFPANQLWVRGPQSVATDTGKDYAIVARFNSSETGQPTVVIAGLSHSSNIAAVNFVLSAQELKQLDAAAPKNWRDHNLEFVLEMTVVDGHAGQPVVLAAETW